MKLQQELLLTTNHKVKLYCLQLRLSVPEGAALKDNPVDVKHSVPQQRGVDQTLCHHGVGDVTKDKFDHLNCFRCGRDSVGRA